MANHLFERIRHAAEENRDRPALECPAAALTYSDMIALSGRYAAALGELGARLGDRVAVQVEKSPGAIMLYLGAIRAGAIFLPLNPAYTDAELAYFLADAEPKILVCDPARHDALVPLARQAGVRTIPTLDADGRGSLSDRCAACAPRFADAARTPDDLAAILYTSGTTGRSKGAKLTHGNLLSNAEALARIWHFSPEDSLLHALPLYHTHGLFVAINTVLLSGARILLQQKFDPDQCLALMPRATVMMGVPTFYTRLLRHRGLSREATAHMRLFISGSAPLLRETHKEWQERTGHKILERYGMTESGMIASNPYEGERRAGSVGLPLPDVSVRIASLATGDILAQGETGVIEVKGPNVFKGYWRSPKKTAQEFRSDGYFVTGDLGRIDSGGYLHILGRAKDLVISGGLNVYPGEVEALINALPGVAESAVIGPPHEDFGEAVAAIVVRAPSAVLNAPSIQNALAKKLAKYKVPKRVLFVEEFPRKAMGKVQKNLLREKFADLFTAPTLAVPVK